ncbi:hypothetical protein RND81_10G160500 [Saponaria officinalis]|uniref:Uncharacterized protein n=1 Tax=Saponaria officinalis TaxID=3572 RepID=A0AAW1I5E2_SAPOF
MLTAHNTSSSPTLPKPQTPLKQPSKPPFLLKNPPNLNQTSPKTHPNFIKNSPKLNPLLNLKKIFRIERGAPCKSAPGSLLALRTDPLKPRVDQIKKQADDHRNLVLAYASYARKLKLENSKMLRIFAELSRNYTDLLRNPTYQGLFESDSLSIDESMLRQFEKEVKERIKLTRQVIAEAKESFDNQLKIQKLKDTIFGLNEQLTKAKKQGAFSSLIAAKSIPKSIHCLSMRLMEERIERAEKYSDEGKPPMPELEDPNLYHYAIFSDNVIAASGVVNSAVKNAKDPIFSRLYIVQ